MRRKKYFTKRLQLRPLALHDFCAWYECYANRPPARNAFDRGPAKKYQCTKAKFAKIVRRHETLAQKDRVYIYAAFLRNGGALIGAVDIAVTSRPIYGLANLGYQLDNRFWGNGYGREMTEKACRFAFSDLRLHRLEAATDLKNVRSQKLARAIGMRSEGVSKFYLNENGRWLDQRVYILTPELLV